MGRFEYDDYDIDFPNQGELWWANIERALSGRKGQAALRELREALLELPEKRLIEGRLATPDGGMCAVGVLSCHRRVAAGEDRKSVVAELSRLVSNECETCWHGEAEHGTDGCERCHSPREVEYRAKTGLEPRLCKEFVDSGYSNGDGELVTAEEGVRVGLTFALAWRLEYLNDSDFEGLSPEDRYVKVLAWVERALGLVPA